jgi:ParB-like chromosome segregation protein Spo0J
MQLGAPCKASQILDALGGRLFMLNDDHSEKKPRSDRKFDRPVIVRNDGWRSVESSVSTVLVSIGSLKLSGSPRLDGEDPAHVRLLMDVDDELPPILVHRQTMRVIDGRHRLRAATLRGATEIAVEFFEGDENDAFIMAVKANVAHGFPLSLADRRAAAARIVELHPEWSDRAIAAAAGLSADTVGAIRRRSTAGSEQLNVRVGRDGRVRPVDPAQGRLRASEMFAVRPHASLREVAREAGIAVGTVRDVRERIRCGLDPVPGGPAKNTSENAPKDDAARAEKLDPQPSPAELEDMISKLQNLRKDPSLRFTDAGRRLLRLLDQHALSPEEKAWLVTSVPMHCANVIADLARVYSTVWQGLADAIEQQAKRTAV